MFSDYLSRVVFNKENIKDFPVFFSVFCKTKNEAISRLEEAFIETSPTVVVDKKPIKFDEQGFLIEAVTKRVGIFKGHEEQRTKTNRYIYINSYRDDEREGYLLSVEILTPKYFDGSGLMVNSRNVATAKILQKYNDVKKLLKKA